MHNQKKLILKNVSSITYYATPFKKILAICSILHVKQKLIIIIDHRPCDEVYLLYNSLLIPLRATDLHLKNAMTSYIWQLTTCCFHVSKNHTVHFFVFFTFAWSCLLSHFCTWLKIYIFNSPGESNRWIHM